MSSLQNALSEGMYDCFDATVAAGLESTHGRNDGTVSPTTATTSSIISTPPTPRHECGTADAQSGVCLDHNEPHINALLLPVSFDDAYLREYLQQHDALTGESSHDAHLDDWQSLAGSRTFPYPVSHETTVYDFDFFSNIVDDHVHSTEGQSLSINPLLIGDCFKATEVAEEESEIAQNLTISPAALQSGTSPRIARHMHVGSPGPSRSRGVDRVRPEPYPNSKRPSKKGSRVLVNPIPFYGAGPSRANSAGSAVECKVLRCGTAVGTAQNNFYAHIRAHIPPAPADRHPSDVWVRCSWDRNGSPCGEHVQADSYPRHCHNVHVGAGKYRCPGCEDEQSRPDAFRRHMHSCRRMCFKCFLPFTDVKNLKEHRKKCAEPAAILPKGWRNMPFTDWGSKEAQTAIRATGTLKRAAGGSVHTPPTRRESDGHV